jgi:hypothetical protein
MLFVGFSLWGILRGIILDKKAKDRKHVTPVGDDQPALQLFYFPDLLLNNESKLKGPLPK